MVEFRQVQLNGKIPLDPLIRIVRLWRYHSSESFEWHIIRLNVVEISSFHRLFHAVQYIFVIFAP